METKDFQIKNYSSKAGRLLYLSLLYNLSAKKLMEENHYYDFLVPVFCLRHSIELLQKSIITGAKKDFSTVHNLLDHHVEMKKWWDEIDFDKETKTLFSKKEFDTVDKNTPAGRYKFFKKELLFKQLEKLSNKYCNHQYLGEDFPDPKNIYLRYPDNMKFDERLYSMLRNPEKIIECKKNIEKDIENVFVMINFLFYGVLTERIKWKDKK